MSARDDSCVTSDLADQEWYWANATKEDISSAIESPDGTFCVRDASTKRDFTLTLRFGERNRLMRILVLDDRCGFTEDAMKFDTVVSLIDYYKRNSLAEYNRQLATKLLYPMKRPSSRGNVWVVDGVRSIEHLLCHLRGLHATYVRVVRQDDQLSAELESLKEDLQRKRQARAAFSTAYSLFVKQLEILENCRSKMTSEAEIGQLDANKSMQNRRLESIRSRQEQVSQQIKTIQRNIRANEASHTSLTPKISNLYGELDACQFRLCQLNVPQAMVEKVLQEVSILTDVEQESLASTLLQLQFRWEPDRYLSLDCTKENAQKIIRSLMDCNPGSADGIFLIRPSQSHVGHYALTISNNNQIFNCLIEYRDIKHPESCGFSFLNTKLFFPTLADFVRYYSHYSMKDHNAQLDTKLRIPAFKGTL